MGKKAIMGIGAGIISGMFTAGGGLLLIPLLLYTLHLDEKEARSTTICCMLPMVVTTAFFYGRGQHIQWHIGILCAIGGMIGAVLGTDLLKKMPVKYLKILFILFLLYAAWNLIGKG